MNVHQEAIPHLAVDLNVILLSHQGTESRPWVAKGYSVANEVCTGPVGNGSVTPKLFDTAGQPYSMAQASAVGWHSFDAETMKHVDHKTGFSLVVLIPSTLNTHFNMHFTHYVCVNKKSLWECAHCWVSLLIMTAQSAAVFYWLFLIRSMIIHHHDKN